MSLSLPVKCLTPQSSKNLVFSAIFVPLEEKMLVFGIYDVFEDGVKSQKIARLHLNSTFFLSQSLPQSSKSKNCPSLSGPQNAMNYGVL